MTRYTKTEATRMLKEILGGRKEQAHSPKLRAEMVRDHGTPTYTAKAWIAHQMGRGKGGLPTSAIREGLATGKIRANRKAGTTKR